MNISVPQPDSTKLSYLASVSATKEVLDAFGLATKKALGQHFLINDGVVRKICDLAEVSHDDVVIEVGPGIGTLSVALLQRAGGVIAVERDSDLPQVLAQTTASFSTPFVLIEADALTITPEVLEKLKTQSLPYTQPNKLVSNLPYAVAATIVLDYFEHLSISSATVMVQAEVADRMMALPGTKNYGAYTVKLGLYAKSVGKFNVSEGNFFPPPRVKSAVIRLDRHNDALEKDLIEATALMADAAFANRRKTITNSCRTFFKQQPGQSELTPEVLETIFNQAGIDPTVRGEQLDRTAFLALGEAYLKVTRKDQ